MNLSPECVTAVVLLALASLDQLWSAERLRRHRQGTARRGTARSGVAERRMQVANRLMAAAMLVNLVLGTVATMLWADASIGGPSDRTSPPLLWPLILFVAGVLVSVFANALARSAPSRQAVEPPPHRPVRPVL